MTTIDYAPQAIDTSKVFDKALLESIPEALDIRDLGDGLKMIESKPAELDHDFCTEILSWKEVPADRALNQYHVLRLLSSMQRGTFLPEQVNIISCKFNGDTYRVNGQHCSHARLQMPRGYRCPVRHMRYVAKTENDLRRLYASVDRGKARSKANVVNSYLFGTPEYDGFTKSIIRLVSEGIGVWLWEKVYERTARDGDDRSYLLMTDYLSIGQATARFLSEHQSDKIRFFLGRAPVVAAIMATHNKNKADADRFWSSIVDGVGYDGTDDPRNYLRTFLMTSTLQGSSMRQTPKKATTQEEMFRVCIASWNAWRQGLKIKGGVRVKINNPRPEVM